ncbi:T-cell-specific surface glycoprotein CD28-like [Protopterus annectens]|uniref:T-cell-specific surface glycoprotein CD28-like n=1 Tax=Protopterus annectens TaxID=7888 RepID=UPI001CF9772C|nr:T-cell-specific surface glycoprotein CD28-like [Protopterus annectens]
MRNIPLATLWIIFISAVDSSALTVFQSPVAFSQDGVVSLICNYNYSFNVTFRTEFRATLLKGQISNNNIVCSFTYNASVQELTSRSHGFHCHGRPTSHNISISLINLSTNDTDMYFCKIEKMYPAPYYNFTGSGTYIHVLAALTVFQSPVAFSQDGVVSLMCNYSYSFNITFRTEFRATLLKGQISNNNIVCSFTYNASVQELTSRSHGFHCHGRPTSHNISISLINLSTNDTDMYFCKIEKIYPTPYYNFTGSGTYIHVLAEKPCVDFWWIIIAASIAAFFVLYSLIITVGYVICIYEKMQKQNAASPSLDIKPPADSNSEYMPMKAVWNGAPH